MAKYGARYLQWAPFADANADVSAEALPKYGTPMNLGPLVKVTDAPAFSEAKLPGDDNPTQEYVVEFKECPVDVELTELANTVASAVLGAKLDETSEDLHHNAEDNAPYGGLSFFISKLVNNAKYYQGIFYPKLKASMQGNEYTSKGDSITLTGGKLHFLASMPQNGDWKIESKDFHTVAEAKSWVDEKIKKASA